MTQKKLIEEYGHPSILYKMDGKKLPFLLTEKQQHFFNQSKDKRKICDSFKKLTDMDAEFIHRESRDFPEKLLTLYDAPFGLYLKGILPSKEKKYLSIVGARNATSYGLAVASEYAEILSSYGIGIVSGMAAGIDRAAHTGALHAKGYTLGILGGGIDTKYPRNNFNLYYEMYERGGILSEYNIGIKNMPGLFPRRNRLIAAYSDGVFVVEARERSGSLITADQALELGKDVFALPGRVNDPASKGCNDLIAQGAVIVTKPEDILENLSGTLY